jgi:hypothetical protein
LIGRAKEVGGVDEDGEESASDAAAKASLDAIAEEMITIALDALDKIFEGAKELTNDKILEQAAAAILAIAVGGLLNKSGLETTDEAIKLIAAIASAYTAFYPDDGSGSGSVPFPEIFKGISSSSSSSSSSASDKKSEEDKIQLLRDLIGAYNSTDLSDKYPNFGSAKQQLQTFLSALGKK